MENAREEDLKSRTLFDTVEKLLKTPAFSTDMAKVCLLELLFKSPDAVLSEKDARELKHYAPFRLLLASPDPDIKRITRGAIALRYLGGLNHYDLKRLRDCIQDGGIHLMINALHDLKLEGWALLKECFLATRHVTSLETVSSNLSELDNSDWDTYCQMLLSLTQLTALDLKGNLNEIQITRLQRLCQVIQAFPFLTSLNVSDNYLGKLDFYAWHVLCQMFQATPHLASLNLRNNYLGSLDKESWQVFSKTIQKASHITSLDLGYSRLHMLDEDCWKIFNEMLKGATHIISLGLFHFGEVDANRSSTLFNTILQMTHLTSLDLSYNDLVLVDDDTNVWQSFCEMLEIASQLHSLSLMGNKLRILDLNAWKKFCQAAQHVTSLDLSDNGLSDFDKDDLKSFCQMLGEIRHLTSLKLGRNHLFELSNDGWAVLIEMLQGFPHLTSLALNSNSLYSISETAWETFWAMVQGSSLTSLDLKGNWLSALSYSQWQSFCKGIQATPRLAFLNLEGNSLTRKEHLPQLMSALELHFNLVSLQMDAFSKSDETTVRIQEILLRNQQLLDARQRGEAFLPIISSQQGVELKPVQLKESAAAVLQLLTDAIALLNECSGPEADAYQARLQQLHDDIAFRVASCFGACNESVEALAYYQDVTPESGHYGEARLSAFLLVLLNHVEDPNNATDDPEKRARQAFLEALPLCLNAKNRLISFENLNMRDFDGFLLQAVGIPKNALINMIGNVTQTIRLKLLQYLMLIDLREKLSLATSSQAQTNFFQTERQGGLRDKLATLPSISSLDELVKLPILELWEFAKRGLTQAPLSAEIDVHHQLRLAVFSDEVPDPLNVAFTFDK